MHTEVPMQKLVVSGACTDLSKDLYLILRDVTASLLSLYSVSLVLTGSAIYFVALVQRFYIIVTEIRCCHLLIPELLHVYQDFARYFKYFFSTQSAQCEGLESARCTVETP